MIGPHPSQPHRVTKPAQHQPKHKKLPKLPPTAKVHKRPLHHPAIPSPYAGASQQKVIYVSARTPFLSAIKRVEKLLHLSDKRLVQSATTLAKQQGGRKRKRSAGDGDEILDIAREVERLKGAGGKRRQTDAGRVQLAADEEGAAVGEEVLLKGTGKAIARVMEMGVWFQQREEYSVRLRTGTVGAIDDIEVAEDEGDNEPASEGGAPESEDMDVDETRDGAEGVPLPLRKTEGSGRQDSMGQNTEAIPETRIRYTSMLEVAVSLR